MNENYKIEKNVRPPRFAYRFLAWFCPEFLMEGIAGDLMEEFEKDIQSSGKLSRYRIQMAKLRFIWGVLKFFRPSIILRNKVSSEWLSAALLRNYFKISYRHLTKNKTFAAINSIGLAIGMASALLIYEYVSFEKSFDSFHARADQIYRVTTVWNEKTTSGDHRATTVPWSGPGVKEAFPEVLDYARFAPIDEFTGYNAVSYNNHKISEQSIFLADPGFLRMFSFPLVKGNRDKALNDPNSIVLTASIARKYFGNEDPIGKLIFLDTHGNLAENNFKVTGVIQDPPKNSHLQFDFLLSFNVVWEGLSSGSTYWHWDYTYCYLLVQPKANVEALGKKISALREKMFSAEMGDWNDVIDFKLQPLKDIHLYSSLKGEMQVNSDGRSLYFLVIIGMCIILSAYINYVNMSSVKAIERKTEIGIRKVVGSSKMQLTVQLLIESLVLNIFAVAMAVIIFRLSIPVIEQLFSIQWPAWNFSFFTSDFMLYSGGIIAAGIILSALYPAFVLVSFKPALVLKGKGTMPARSGSWTFRKLLIVLQFVFCIFFTIGTYALYRQVRFMKNHDLGMNMERVLAIRGYGFQSFADYENFHARVAAKSFVNSVGASSSAPGDEIIQLSLKPKVRVANRPATPMSQVKLIIVDQDFFETLHIEMLAGRNFSRTIATDGTSVVVNEAAARLLGYEDERSIIDELLAGIQEKEARIIGVIKNYHQRSLKDDIEPTVFVPNWTWDKTFGWNKRYFFVRLNPVNDLDEYQRHISELEKSWKVVNPDKPFHYFFLDNYFDQQYQADTTFSALFLFFAAFAIFIACLGLFGLVAYTTLQRTKEIGIRKVLGASVNNVLVLLSGDFIKQIVIATCIALPLLIWGLRHWLQQYAFQIPLSGWLFLPPLVLIFTIALLTVVLKSLKVATANPVDSLKYE
jgi:putative ABC transport system permease protein